MNRLLLLAGCISVYSFSYAQVAANEISNGNQGLQNASALKGLSGGVTFIDNPSVAPDKIVFYKVGSERGNPAASEITESISPSNQRGKEFQKISPIRTLVEPVLIEKKNLQPK